MKKILLNLLFIFGVAFCIVMPTAAASTPTTVTDETTLKAAVADTSVDTIVLWRDVTLTSNLSIQLHRRCTLDLNGYTLKYESTSADYVIKISNGAAFTLEDSSTAKTGRSSATIIPPVCTLIRVISL